MIASALDEVDDLCFSIFFATEGEVARAVSDRLSKWWKNGVECAEDLGDLVPLRMRKEHNPDQIRVALYSIAAARPAILLDTNLFDGFASLTYTLLGELHSPDVVKVRSRPRNEWPIEEIQYIEGGNRSAGRLIWAMRECNRWKFGSLGAVRSFEEPESYSRRAIKDRLTRAMILRYVERIGVDLEAVLREGAYTPLACFTERPRGGL